MSDKNIKEINIELIKANKEQPRKFFDEESINELAESIKSLGIIQPITVRESEDGLYTVVSGERRLRAAKIAGLENIPCIIANINNEENDLIALIAIGIKWFINIFSITVTPISSLLFINSNLFIKNSPK